MSIPGYTYVASSGSFWGTPYNPNLTTISGNGWGPVQVNVHAAGAFTGFFNDLAATGYPLTDLQSYNPRPIAGTDIWSQHSYGAAVDITPSGGRSAGPTVPYPSNIGDLAAKNGINWGQNFSNPDQTHFEVAPSGVDRTPGAAPAPSTDPNAPTQQNAQ